MMTTILLNISLICTVVFVLILWFDTDLITSLSNVNKLTRFLFRYDRLKEYADTHNKLLDVWSYPDFLYETYPNVITKALTCAICTCFWITLVGLVVFTLTSGMPLMFAVAILPINYIASLFIYLSIRKLL